MSAESLKELLGFLKPESRIDLKHLALDALVGLSANNESLEMLLKNEEVIQEIIELTSDREELIAKNALLFLVNVSAHPECGKELLKYRPSIKRNIIELLISYILDPQKKDADAACMILNNMTRDEDTASVCLNSFLPHLNDLLNVFVNIEFNKVSSNLNYLAPLFSNLSCNNKVRKWLVEENPHVPLIKLLPFCNYDKSNIRKGGAIGTVRNLSFDIGLHDFLLKPDLDLLTYLLNPLMGDEDYCDEEMDALPITLQYLPKEKQREPDADIRKMILETLNKLCSKRNCREILRSNGVYYVLRELHKWEKDPLVLLACENVVDILIQKENEVGAEDLSAVDIPNDMTEKFKKMDEDYLKNIL